MSNERFDDFFRAAFAGERTPFDYQRHLACDEDGQGRECVSLLIDVPTGCGKTAAVVLAWLWNRVAHPDADHRARWPRRLVYCLPMRTLVEQTQRECRRWLRNIWRARAALALSPEAIESLRQLRLQGPVLLMGGTPKNSRRRPQWDLYPGRDAILIGTQDMLLSRALNRGYGLSRFRWPMAFGLLNHDCLWVLDETQLMGVGVETSAQLDGFRHQAELGAPTRTFTWWMSATLATAQLETVDHPRPAGGWTTVELLDDDKKPGTPVQKRRAAVKRLAQAPVALTPGDKGDYTKKLADFIRQQHDATVAARQAGQPAVLTLVVLNRVTRAREVYQALQKRKVPAENLALVHSRFRPGDRRRHEKVLFAKDTDRIVVATQAVEAGVDVSARTLVTELAAWPSLVQRFGRCNREGEWPGGTEVFWIDVRPKDDKDDLRLPYTATELADARELLDPLNDVGLGTLSRVAYTPAPQIRSVIRRKDLLDLFDTTADLLGHDLDISRYVRDAEDTDVQVFWREVPVNDQIPEDEPEPTRSELCRVSLKDMGGFLKKKPRVFVWDGLEGVWRKAGDKPRPGVLYLVDHAEGGYDDRLGWTGAARSKESILTLLTPPRAKKTRRYDGNNPSLGTRSWILLDNHTANVVAMLEEVLRDTLPLTEAEDAALRDAALWHDVGKGHEVFQELLQRAVLKSGEDCPDSKSLWAKSAGTRPFASPKYRGFRHELASALAWLQQVFNHSSTQHDLTAFLIAAHHGRVRLSIRSLPDETLRPDDPDRLHARGVWDGDLLPRASFPEAARDGVPTDGFKLALGYMRMGDDGQNGPSWLARMLALRDSPEFGPFRLAYLETLLRAADQRASAKEVATVPPLSD